MGPRWSGGLSRWLLVTYLHNTTVSSLPTLPSHVSRFPVHSSMARSLAGQIRLYLYGSLIKYIMKRKFKQWWSTILPIPTKQRKFKQWWSTILPIPTKWKSPQLIEYSKHKTTIYNLENPAALLTTNIYDNLKCKTFTCIITLSKV